MMTLLKRQMLTVAVAALSLAAASPAAGQFRVGQSYWTLGGTVGISGYAGDLTNAKTDGIPFTQIETLRNLGFEVGVQVGYRLNPRWSVRGGISYLLIRGSDESASDSANRLRNLSFENGLIEANAVLMFDLLPPKRNYRLRRLFEPYVFAGIALAYSDPRAYIEVGSQTGIFNPGSYLQNGVNTFWPGTGPLDFGWQRLRPLRTEAQATEYSPIVISVPFGAGVRIKVAEHWNVGVEANFRYAFTDFLDDVSGTTPTRPVTEVGGNYPLPSDLDNSLLRIAASNRLLQNSANFDDRRGGSGANDWYGSVGVNLTYILDGSPGGVRCPRPSRKKKFFGIF